MIRIKWIVGAALVVAAPSLAVANAEVLTQPNVTAIAAGQPATAGDWYAIAQSHFNAKNYKQSIAAFQRSMQLGGVPGASAAVSIARAYALDGNHKQAFRWVELAIAAGDCTAQAMRNDPTFAKYRDDPVFKKLIRTTLSSLDAMVRVPAVRRM